MKTVLPDEEFFLPDDPMILQGRLVNMSEAAILVAARGHPAIPHEPEML
ncbi:hypothetical protein [Ancylobacter sp. TS-1]|nr:hypothetical protein [Ancylobacter sp. TS-1]